MAEPLPPDFEERLALLANRNKRGESSAAILRRKYVEATTDRDRQSIVRAADALLQPSGRRWPWALLVGVPLSILGLSFWTDHNHAEKVAQGQRALAKVVRLDEGFCWFGSKKSECVKLTLEVHPEDGSPFQATLNHDLPQRHLARVEPGRWLYVARESGDPRSILLDERALAEPAPTPREKP